MWRPEVSKLARIKADGTHGLIVKRARFDCFQMQGDPVWRHASEYAEPTRRGWCPAFQAEKGTAWYGLRTRYTDTTQNLVDDLVAVPMSDDLDPACTPEEYRRQWPSPTQLKREEARIWDAKAIERVLPRSEIESATALGHE